MKRSLSWVLQLFVLGCLLAACGLSQPLGPSLELSTPSIESPQASIETPDALAASSTAEAATPDPQPLCGGPESMLILAIASDTRDDNYLYGLADAVRLVRVDFVAPRITALSFPRDLWVRIPGIEDHYGLTHGKLNQSYLYGNPGMGYYDGPGGGPGLLARTLNENFGIRPDHYGAVNMLTFVKLVDAVGGIDIYLPEPVDGRPIDDKTEDMGYFPAGQRHFNGDQALRFSRIRKIDNAFKRDDRQTQVLCALKEKLQQPSVIADIPAIISAFSGSVQTDLSVLQMTQLACLLPYLDGEDLIFESISEEMFEPGRNPQGAYVLFPDEDAIRRLAADFVDGSWPTEPDEPSCP